MLDRLQFRVYVFHQSSVGVQPNSGFHILINGHAGESFGGVAAERIQKPYDVPIDLVSRPLDHSTGLLAALLEAFYTLRH